MLVVLESGPPPVMTSIWVNTLKASIVTVITSIKVVGETRGASTHRVAPEAPRERINPYFSPRPYDLTRDDRDIRVP